MKKSFTLIELPVVRKRAFTLIELLVVIAIIGILSATILVALNQARNKAKDARVVTDVTQAARALQIYQIDNGNYNVGTCVSNSANPASDCDDTTSIGAWGLPVNPTKNQIATLAQDVVRFQSGTAAYFVVYISSSTVPPAPANYDRYKIYAKYASGGNKGYCKDSAGNTVDDFDMNGWNVNPCTGSW